MADTPSHNSSRPDPRPISLLLFRAHGTLFGLDANAVHEIVLLPEIKPLPNQPPQSLGVIDVRGKIVPTFDLTVCVGCPAGTLSLNDKLLILEWSDTMLALRVSDVIGVREVRESEVAPLASLGNAAAQLIRGIARVQHDVVLLLDLDRLFASLQVLCDAGSSATVATKDARPDLFEGFSPEQREELRARAQRLGVAVGTLQSAEVVPQVVLEMSGELFAVGLRCVREFLEPASITPVPCCPAHVLGNVNLRGEILTVVDIRSALNLAPPRESNGAKVLVVQSGELVVGIEVDAWHDIVHVQSSQIVPLPHSAQGTGVGYLSGAVPYRDRMLSLLDLEKLLALDRWVVQEEVGRS